MTYDNPYAPGEIKVEQLPKSFQIALDKRRKRIAAQNAKAKPEPETGPLTVKTFDDRCHRAYDLFLAGRSQKEIADAFGISVSTVKRWHKRYTDLFAAEIETAKKLHLVSKRCLEYSSLARQSLRDAEFAKNDKDRGMFRRLALKCYAQQDVLLSLVGGYPAEPAELYDNFQKMEPVDREQARQADNRSEQEVVDSIVGILARTRKL